MLDIRPITAADHAAWLPLWQGYQRFYNATIADETSALTWQRFLDPAEPMHAALTWRDGAAVGLVHYIFHRSCWTSGDYCYLQDLFVAENIRGGGIGRALIEHVYAQAAAAHMKAAEGHRTAAEYAPEEWMKKGHLDNAKLHEHYAKAHHAKAKAADAKADAEVFVIGQRRHVGSFHVVPAKVEHLSVEVCRHRPLACDNVVHVDGEGDFVPFIVHVRKVLVENIFRR